MPIELLICGLDEFAQYFWHGCLFRFSLPDHMYGLYGDTGGFFRPSEDMSYGSSHVS